MMKLTDRYLVALVHTIMHGIRAAEQLLDPNVLSRGGIPTKKGPKQAAIEEAALNEVVSVLDVAFRWYGDWGMNPYSIRLQLMKMAQNPIWYVIDLKANRVVAEHIDIGAATHDAMQRSGLSAFKIQYWFPGFSTLGDFSIVNRLGGWLHYPDLIPIPEGRGPQCL